MVVTSHVNLKSHVYFPGNVVEGVVSIHTDESISFTAIRVKLTGKETVQLQPQGRSNNDPSETVVVHKHLVTLAGLMKTASYTGDATPFELPQGTYTYPFAIPIPATAPPSLHLADDGFTASIQWCVKAYIECPNPDHNSHAKDFIKVLQAMPKQQSHAPTGMTHDKHWDLACCCCIPNGERSARLVCDKTTIAVDRDQLVVYADVDNTAGQEAVHSFELFLMHQLSVRAKGQTKMITRCIGSCTISSGQVDGGARGRFLGAISELNTKEAQQKLIPTMSGCDLVLSLAAADGDSECLGATQPGGVALGTGWHAYTGLAGG